MCNKQQIPENGATKYVASGEIVTGTKNERITSTPLGSCVAVVAYDTKKKIGGIAHVMLSGKSIKKNGSDKNKYAIDAIDNLFSELYKSGAQNTNIEICLAGGANVLKKENDSISVSIINSVLQTIKKKKITICASSLGGFERRSATLLINIGIAYYTIGGSSEKILWEFA